MHGSWAWTLGAFFVALGVLIVVHEFGHYLVARLAGVKILRFSLGFGRPLLARRFGADGTEWVLAAFPLGGYVKMLDEREGPVAASELHRAFNRQPLSRRASIVVAGPLANFLLAIALYAALFVSGVDELRPIFGAPTAGSAAAAAGITAGDTVRKVSDNPVLTLSDLRWELMRCVLDGRPAELEVKSIDGTFGKRRLDTSSIDAEHLDSDIARQLGLTPYRPPMQPRVGHVATGSPADEAGIKATDEIVAVAERPVQTVEEVVNAVSGAAGKPLTFTVKREGSRQTVTVVPQAKQENGKTVGRIGIDFRPDPVIRDLLLVNVRLNIGAATVRAVGQTWDTSALILRMIGRMMIGKLSLRNISGPITIADYAGQSAQLGLEYFLKFLAMISISLAVLNLLPIPVLDGGHLLYYLAEFIKGGPLSERTTEIGQQIGLGLLILLMAFAFFNDISRLISG